MSAKILSFLKQKKILLIIFIVVVLLMFLALASYKKLKNSNQIVCGTTKSKYNIEYAAKLLAKNSLEQADLNNLGKTVSEIEGIKKYDNDINCLNTITSYYINISDYKDADNSYSKLVKIYKSDNDFNAVFAPKNRSLLILKANIEFLKQQDEEYKKTRNFGNL